MIVNKIENENLENERVDDNSAMHKYIFNLFFFFSLFLLLKNKKNWLIITLLFTLQYDEKKT